MPSALFISYSHRDMQPVNWLDRLKLYLAPLRRQEPIDIWDDTRIQVGGDWHEQISEALESASAAILLVGPGFLASEFILDHELPALLNSAQTRDVKIYPLLIGYCAYRNSDLGPYQSFNDPNQPLESLPLAEQNKILNDLSMAVDETMRHSPRSRPQGNGQSGDLTAPLQAIQMHLRNTYTAFVAQCRRRNDLVAVMIQRLQIRDRLEYEKFFFRYYDQMSDEEKFEFDQIRAMTEGPLYDGNRAILDVLNQQSRLLDAVPALVDLRQHLVFWLNKYDKVFKTNKRMCLLYTGVEDGVPFPAGLDRQIAKRLAGH